MPRLKKYEIDAITNKIHEKLSKDVKDEVESVDFEIQIEEVYEQYLQDNQQLLELVISRDQLSIQLQEVKDEIRQYTNNAPFEGVNIYSGTSLENIKSHLKSLAEKDVTQTLGLTVPPRGKIADEVVLSAVEGLDNIVDRVIASFSEI